MNRRDVIAAGTTLLLSRFQVTLAISRFAFAWLSAASLRASVAWAWAIW
jgi:hypothetical protein